MIRREFLRRAMFGVLASGMLVDALSRRAPALVSVPDPIPVATHWAVLPDGRSMSGTKAQVDAFLASRSPNWRYRMRNSQ